MKINCKKCDIENNVNDVECSSNGSSGYHMVSYTYSAFFTCWRCKHENDLTIITNEHSDTGEVMSSDTIEN